MIAGLYCSVCLFQRLQQYRYASCSEDMTETFIELVLHNVDLYSSYGMEYNIYLASGEDIGRALDKNDGTS